ncbi:BTB/POZ domain-containing protein 7-like isoform X2 [Ornithodoros turicata]|uniref:BTB/POZ domain-containing protein 7-like isoform X2 n=1 Tax=Ornithodoros turicata TaxID=34597 RepID=UPI0031389541
MGASTSMSPPDVEPPDRKKKGAPLTTLRKRLARRRWRSFSKCCDHGQVFHDFLSSSAWNLREVAALVREYEALATLRELSVQADLARSPARLCRNDLARLLESRLCADVTVAYRGTAFPAHRAILSARCPFFRELLSEPGTPCQPVVVEMDIPGVGVDLFRDLLRYLYTGELSVGGNGTALSTLVRLSEQFGVPNALTHDLKRMLECGHLADASLVWEGAEFPCHRAILAARSPFFHGVVQRRSTEALRGRMRVVLDGSVVPLRFARLILCSLYQDNVDLSSLACTTTFAEELMELYEASRMLELDTLTQCCEDALVELLSPETLLAVLEWSDLPHGSPFVRRQALAFLRDEFSALATSPAFLQLSKHHLLQVLQSDFLQASELEVLVVVLKWGEHQLLKRMEEREPNVVSHTAHSVARRAPRSRRELLSDTELRELLSELLCQVRTAHILPPNSEALVSALRRGLLPCPPPCMLGGDESCAGRGSQRAWLRPGPTRPRLFLPYVEEAKTWLEEHLSSQELLPLQHHLSHIPDTLYMVERPFQEGPTDPALPAPNEETLRQMRVREEELRTGASRAYSVVANRGEVTRLLQLRVVREFGLPDEAVAVLQQWLPASQHEERSVPRPTLLAPEVDSQWVKLRPALWPEVEGTSAKGMREISSFRLRAGVRAASTSSLYAPLSRAQERRLVERHVTRRRALRATQLPTHSESHLSDVIPDIAMATAALEHLELVESDSRGDSVHVLV